MSAAVASPAAHPAPLDPYKNISTTAPTRAAVVPAVEGQDDYAPGRYRWQYERAATNGAWGYAHGTCGRATLWKEENGVITLMPALCGCWACELCGVRRAAWLKQEIGQAQQDYGLFWFWTLTIGTETCTAAESFRRVKAAWNWARKDLCRAHGHFSYVWTVEATKRGFAHLHLLTSLDVPRRELSTRWETASGGSFIVDVQPVASERAANYLSKYCVQQATLRREVEWDALKHHRMFSKSRDVQFEPFRSPGDGTWELRPAPYWEEAATLRNIAPVRSENVRGVPCLKVVKTW